MDVLTSVVDFVTTRPLLTAVLSTLALVVLFIYRFCYGPYQVLKRYGIQGPVPKAFFGDLPLMSKTKGFLGFIKYMYKNYTGPVSGFYIGREPCIFVNDPELIKQVTVKEFNSFSDHYIPLSLLPETYSAQGLFAENGETWRNNRHILSPAFSASKMKQMVPLIKRSADTLVEKVGEAAESGESIDVMKLFGTFTMESILAAAFGRVINLQKGEADEVTEAAKGVFALGKDVRYQLCQAILAIAPVLQKLLQYCLVYRTELVEPFKVLQQTALKLIEARRAGTAKQAKYKDILQLMLDAAEDGDETAVTSEESTSSCPVQHSSKKHKLSNAQLVHYAMSFLGAGYETTANTICYASYLLALNPEIQEKLQSEIDSYFDEKPDASLYEASHDITYLDSVIQETLRIYPTAPLTNRRCMKTTTIGEVTFPKGIQLMIPIIGLHHDPKYWESPEKFNPDRFTPEERAKRPAMVHLPFGAGPRNCIGMRFALLEAKTALIQIMKKYSFVRAPNTEVPLKLTLGFTLTPLSGAVYLKVVSRT